ncbi:hypothetical protein [Nonlabens tegetincola]|uniref:hypothetical protein n=1 Tax=Nonlabens tegetincola TaxID=323273 RepID=UPI0005A67AE1|nr:hypothetical protein [Nonlabens tegetincola]
MTYIPYRFTEDVEELLLKVIEENPNESYCVLISQENNITSIELVKHCNFFHSRTAYKAIIGNNYYSISFPQFDIRFGVTEDLNEVMKRKKISSRDNSEFITKSAYPSYHEVYIVKLKNRNEIIYSGYEY